MSGVASRNLAGFLALALGAPAGASAQRQVEVETFFSEPTVMVGATVEYVIAVEAEGRDRVDISPAALPTGLVVTGQNQSSSLDVRVPGGVTRLQRLTLSVLARAPGDYTMPGPGVRVGGTLVRGAEAALTVVGGGGGETPAPSAGADDIALRARLARDTVYVGEPVELITEVLLSDAARRRLRGAPQYFPPTPAGFLIHDLGSGARRFATADDGRRFEIQRFRRVFVPLEAGTYRLPPARVELDLRRSLFDPAFPEVVESERRELVVLDLPPSGRPDGFQGAVGRYAVDARLDPGSTTAGDAVRLEVTVRGSGYVKPLPAPALRPRDGLAFVSPMEEAAVRSTTGGLEGEKTFSWIVIPDKPGVFELPEVRYPYFDPDMGRYAVARSAPLRLEVRGAPEAGSPAAAALAAPREAAHPGGASAWVASGWYAAGQAAPLVAVVLALLAFGPARARPASARDLGKRTEALLRNWAYADAQGRNASLRAWLSDRLQRPDLEGAPAAEIVAAAGDAGASSADARALGRLLASLDATRYGPGGDVALDGDAGRGLIERLHGVLPRPAMSESDAERGRARVRATAALPLVVGVACLGMAVAGARGAAAGPEFGAGLDALRAGDAQLSAAHFAGYVRARPDDAAGWYNLGLAEARNGRGGPAIWAWLNGLRRAPGDETAAANARALGAQEAAIARARGRPPAPAPALSIAATVALYLMAAFALASTRAAARGRWKVATACAGAVAVVLVGTGSLRDRAAPLVVPLDAVALRYEPVRAGEEGQTLAPGTALVPEEVRGPWMRVRVVRPGPEPLREGWIARADVARVSRSTVP